MTEAEIIAGINRTRRDIRELRLNFRRVFYPSDRPANAKIAIAVRKKEAYIKQLQARLTGAETIKKG